MRYYLDTNILVFLIQKSKGDISADTRAIIEDYSNTLFTSSVCVGELIQLCHIGKLESDGHKQTAVSPISVLPWLEEMGIDIVPLRKEHLNTMAGLPDFNDHRDPADRMIISQAISDRILLISSDGKFSRYERYGLEFVFNKR